MSVSQVNFKSLDNITEKKDNKTVYTKIKCLLKNLIPEYLIIIYNKIQRRKYKIEYRQSK